MFAKFRRHRRTRHPSEARGPHRGQARPQERLRLSANNLVVHAPVVRTSTHASASSDREPTCRPAVAPGASGDLEHLADQPMMVAPMVRAFAGSGVP